MNDVQVGNTTLTATALTIGIVISVAIFVVLLVAYTNVLARAGYSRWWILIMIVPVANIVMLLVFCFREWPVTRELHALRARAGGYGDSYGGATPGTRQ